MHTTPALVELEQKFQAMREAAKAENWTLLAKLDLDAKASLAALRKMPPPPEELRQTLLRLQELHQEVFRHVQQCRTDISLLLDAFGNENPGAG